MSPTDLGIFQNIFKFVKMLCRFATLEAVCAQIL